MITHVLSTDALTLTVKSNLHPAVHPHEQPLKLIATSLAMMKFGAIAI